MLDTRIYDRSWMYDHYIIKRLTTSEIGSILGVCKTTVQNHLKKLCIPVRTNIEAHTTNPSSLACLTNYNYMYQKYIIEKKSIAQIAEDLGVGKSAAVRSLKRHSIPRRNRSDAKIVHKSCIELLDDPVFLRTKYITERMTATKISELCRCSRDTVFYHLSKHNIPIRTPKEATARGERSGRWKGGSSFEPYCILFNKKFKENIISKFDNMCYECGRVRGECIIHVHHIDYNKGSICNGKDWGFIPLCPRCHSRTNHNRYKWFNTYINYWVSYYIDFNTFNWW